MSGSVTIEPATLESLPDILHIEEACFSAPWTRKMLEAELNGNRFAHFLLAKQTDASGSDPTAVVGYLCYWIVFEEVRLMNLAVLSSMRRHGVARTLVIHALHTGIDQGAVRAVLEVRASNEGAQALYRTEGFRLAGRRPGYYSFPSEDALIFRRELSADQK